MPTPRIKIFSTVPLAFFLINTSHGGGFSLYTESAASAIGNYAAGSAAEVADASIGWYNPAGLAILGKEEALISGAGVFPRSAISGFSTFVTTPLPNYNESFSQLNGMRNGFVPALHYVYPLREQVAFGLSVVSPFGLSTDWGRQSPVRYQATLTKLMSADISPELGARVSEHFALGLGLDLQYARVTFNRIIGLPALFTFIPPFNPMGADTLSENHGTSFAVGFHAGILGLYQEGHTRLGLNYQSRVRHVFHGYSQLTGPLANFSNLFLPLSPNSSVRSDALSTNDIDFPEIVTLSAYHDLNPQLALLGSIVYTGWGALQQLTLNQAVAPVIDPNTFNLVPSRVNVTSPQNYHNSWRFALGANYRINGRCLIRLGAGYDQTPTNSVDRDVRLPDLNRWALAIGTHYQIKDSLGFDLGYYHLFAANTLTINRNDVFSARSSYTVQATGSAAADIVGAQLVWVIDKPMPIPTK